MEEKDLNKQEQKILKGMVKSQEILHGEEELAKYAKVNVLFVDEHTQTLSQKGLIEKVENTDKWRVTDLGYKVMGESRAPAATVIKAEATGDEQAAEFTVETEQGAPADDAMPREEEVVAEISTEAKPKSKKKEEGPEFFNSLLWQVWIRPACIGLAAAFVMCMLLYFIMIGPLSRSYVRTATENFITEAQLSEATRDRATGNETESLRARVTKIEKYLRQQQQEKNTSAAPAPAKKKRR